MLTTLRQQENALKKPESTERNAWRQFTTEFIRCDIFEKIKCVKVIKFLSILVAACTIASSLFFLTSRAGS
jgi:hypothetical protein